MYVVPIMPTSYYGAVHPVGPGPTTSLDRKNLQMQTDPLYQGGGVPVGGTAHLGHAGWYQSINPVTTPNFIRKGYPTLNDSVYPGVVETRSVDRLAEVSYNTRLRYLSEGIVGVGASDGMQPRGLAPPPVPAQKTYLPAPQEEPPLEGPPEPKMPGLISSTDSELTTSDVTTDSGDYMLTNVMRMTGGLINAAAGITWKALGGGTPVVENGSAAVFEKEELLTPKQETEQREQQLVVAGFNPAGAGPTAEAATQVSRVSHGMQAGGTNAGIQVSVAVDPTDSASQGGLQESAVRNMIDASLENLENRFQAIAQPILNQVQSIQTRVRGTEAGQRAIMTGINERTARQQRVMNQFRSDLNDASRFMAAFGQRVNQHIATQQENSEMINNRVNEIQVSLNSTIEAVTNDLGTVWNEIVRNRFELEQGQPPVPPYSPASNPVVNNGSPPPVYRSDSSQGSGSTSGSATSDLNRLAQTELNRVFDLNAAQGMDPEEIAGMRRIAEAWGYTYGQGRTDHRAMLRDMALLLEQNPSPEFAAFVRGFQRAKSARKREEWRSTAVRGPGRQRRTQRRNPPNVLRTYQQD